jgi:hypothetical protein
MIFYLRGLTLGVALAALGWTGFARADDAAPVTAADPVSDYFDRWFERVDRSQAEQPHWVTPLATTTARLTEQIRYDQLDAYLPNGAHEQIYENGKGIDLIPAENIGIMIGIPPYEARETVKPAQGWTDWPFFRLKYRIASANEENGNYVVTALVQLGAPTGIAPFTAHAYTVSPALAFGKGWGDFDVQTIVSETLPTGDVAATGRTLTWNTAFQYRLWKILSPEVELNDTYWWGGPRGGENQLLMTAGAIAGPIKLVDRTSVTVGLGYQFAVSPKAQLTPALVPTIRNAIYLSTRLNF